MKQKHLNPLILLPFSLTIIIIILIMILINTSSSPETSITQINPNEDTSDELSNSLYEQYPILNILPIIYANYDENWNYTEFRIDGAISAECDNEFCIKISDTTGGNYETALDLIRQKGYNPSDYKIFYTETPIQTL